MSDINSVAEGKKKFIIKYECFEFCEKSKKRISIQCVGIVLDFFFSKECIERYIKAKIEYHEANHYIYNPSSYEMLCEIEKQHSDGTTRIDTYHILSNDKVEEWKKEYKKNVEGRRVCFKILKGDDIILWQTDMSNFQNSYILSCSKE